MVPDHTRGAHPTASGRLRTVVLFRQSYPALTNGGVVDAVVPCGTGGNSLTTWVRDFQFDLLRGMSPRRRRTIAHRAPRVRDESSRSPRSRRTVGRRALRVRDDSGRSPRSARSFFESPRAPDRMLEGAIPLLSQRALSARA